MVDSVASATPVIPVKVAAPPPAGAGRPQQYYTDGSAVPDVIAEHHRPEDLDIEGLVSLPKASESDSGFFGEDGLTFSDVLDIINPLQHIPVVATLYRSMTGDEISPGARVAGGALYGGPIGAGVAIVNAAVEEATGDDIGDTILAALTGDNDTTSSAIAAAPDRNANPATQSDPGSTGRDASPAGQFAQAVAPPSLAPTPAAISVPASAPQVPSSGSSPQTRQPFGGMGALPFTRQQDNSDNPVAAILQARAAVPAAGPVPGLGSTTLTPPAAQPAIPNVSSRLAEKLAALAGLPPPPERAPAKTETVARDKNRDFETRKTAAVSATLQPNPFSQVPQNMMNTLDRYQQMKKAEAADISG